MLDAFGPSEWELWAAFPMCACMTNHRWKLSDILLSHIFPDEGLEIDSFHFYIGRKCAE